MELRCPIRVPRRPSPASCWSRSPSPCWLRCSSGSGPGRAGSARLTVTILASGFTIPWDLTWVGDVMLFDERGGRLWSKRTGSARRASGAAAGPVRPSEGGLMGMVADPGARSNRRFYVCYASQYGGSRPGRPGGALAADHDTTAVRDGSATPWWSAASRSAAAGTAAAGCGSARTASSTSAPATRRPARTRRTASPSAARCCGSTATGSIPADNPFYGQGGNARYVFSYGHRNLQGLAFRPGTRELWSAEHGSDRDDEVNLISAGANYGWDPRPRPPGTTRASR